MPGIFQQIQVTRQPVRIQSLLVQSSEPFLLVNNDLTNSIFIGNDQSTQPVPVPPLGSMGLGGSANHDVWVSTGGVTVTVTAYLLPAGTQWSPSPAQIAAQINALGLAKDTTVGGTTTAVGATTAAVNATPNSTAALIATGSAGGTPGGVPMLRYTNGLGSGTAQTLAGAGTVALVTNAVVLQPGYEMSISCNIPAGVGTIPFASLVLSWIDATTGQTIRTAPYILTLGNGPTNAVPHYINGPCYGNRVSVQLTNLDPAQTMTFMWVLNQTSHVHLADNIIQPVYPVTAPITFSWPGGTPALGVLAMAKPSVGPSSTAFRLMAPYSGKVQVTVDNAGGLNACNIGFVDPTGSLYSNIAAQGGLINSVPAAGFYTAEVALPRGAMLLEIRNPTATNTISPEVIVITKDY